MKEREIKKAGKLKAKNAAVPGGKGRQEESRVMKSGHEGVESWGKT